MPADPAFPLRRWEWGLLAAGLAVRTFLGAASIRAQSPTYDEPIHLAAGVAYWRTGDYGLNGAWHPPLGSLVAGALPVLAGADVPRGHPLWRRPVWTDPDRQYAFANDLLTDGGKTPMDRWLSLGRSAMLGVTHLLPVLVFLAARSVGAFVQGEMLAEIDFGAGILPGSDDLLDGALDQVAFGGQEGVVAGVVGQRNLEAVQGVVALHFGEVGDGGIDDLGDSHPGAAIGDGAGQVGAELISQGDAAADAGFEPFGVCAAEVVAA